ncbi:hypothetical protein ACE2AJ_02830 [Aquihabitans daechungensis]
MKQLMRSRGSHRRPVDRRRSRSADPVIAAELAVIAEVRRSQAPTTTA